MKLFIDGVDEQDCDLLSARGHVMVPSCKSFVFDLEALAGCHAAIFDGARAKDFLIGAAVGLGRDVIIIKPKKNAWYLENSPIRVFEDFEAFLQKVEAGRL